MENNEKVATLTAKKMNGRYYKNFSDFISAINAHKKNPAYVTKDGKLHIIAWLEECFVDIDGSFEGFYYVEFRQESDCVSAALNFIKEYPDSKVEWFFHGSALTPMIPTYEEVKEYSRNDGGNNMWSLYRKYIGYIKKIENAL